MALKSGSCADLFYRLSLLAWVLNNRWPELSDDQCWAMLDQWLGSGSYGRKTDVATDTPGLSRRDQPTSQPRCEFCRILKLLTPQQGAREIHRGLRGGGPVSMPAVLASSGA